MRDAYVTSSFCSGGTCVGVAIYPTGVVLTDTAANEGHELFFTRAQWEAFVAGVKAGEFDLPAGS